MKLVIRNRIFFLVDLLMWVVLPIGATVLVEGGVAGWRLQAAEFTAYVALGAIVKSSVLWLFGVYRRYWLYASIEELVVIARAVVVAGLATGIAYVLLAPVLPGRQLPWPVPILDGLLTLVWVGGGRLSVRLLEYVRLRRAGISGDRVLIVGAGDAGTMIARELASNPQVGLHPVGFIDDNPAKRGARILGIEVLGDRSMLAEIAQDLHVSKVVIAMPTAPGTEIRAIREICEAANLETKTMPGVFELLTGRVRVNAIRDVQIEDLLRRPPVETDRGAVRELVRGATVMVTGAGGSVGSEICRQVARLGAGRVCLLGHGENSIFDIDAELRRRYPGVAVTPVIGDIRDADRMRRVFHATRPDIVFHAAAHKHVPLMEQNPEEAITNNVFGTQNVLAAAENVSVRQFVFISTDKAVEPANVMGATKRIAEGLVQHAASRTGRPYVAVRFGNVLASRGSVVPLFQKQILEGGPITVTHPDVTRFFMTIPEAVQLVLQAAALGSGGEVFVLDMGEPVRIVDLARDLIRLSGLEPDRDIAIQFTGLRPGEKLTEELFDDAESQEPTAHPKVWQVRNGRVPFTLDRLEELRTAAQGGDCPAASRVLNDLLPGWPATTSADAAPEGVLPLRRRRNPSTG